MENEYQKYAEELKKENENLRQNLRNVEEERDYFRLIAQKYVGKYI